MADEKMELLKALLKKELSKSEISTENGKEIATKLESLFTELRKAHEFREGMLVTWKPGLQNKKRPVYNEPVIVIEKKQTVEYDMSDNSGSPYFKEPLDLVAGLLDEEGDFVMLHFDSRRFQPFNP